MIWLESNSQLESASIWLESKPKKLFFLLILVFYKCKWYKKEKKTIFIFYFFWLESESHLTRVKFSNSSWLGSKIIKKLFFISRKFFGLKIISKKHFYLLLYFLLESLFKFIARRLKRWYMKAYSKSLFSCRIIGYTPNFQGICIFRRETRIKRENLKKNNSEEDSRLFVIFYKNFFQFAKSIFFLNIKKNSQSSFDSETLDGGLYFGRKSYFWRSCILVLNIPKK